MALYPHNVDFAPPVQPSGGGKAIAGAKLADVLIYECVPQAAAVANLHAAKVLSATYARTASTASFLATDSPSDDLLKLTVNTTVAVGDVLKDAAAGEYVVVTSTTNKPVYEVTRGYNGSTRTTHLAGATWDLTMQYVAVTLLATELAACPQLVQVTGVGATLAGDCIVFGTDISGATMTETIALSAATTVAGVKAFRTISGYEVPLRVAPADSVSLGTTAIVGMPWDVLTVRRLLAADLNAVADIGTVTYDASIAKCAYTPSETANGAKVLTLIAAY
jgi:hypothetical protein